MRHFLRLVLRFEITQQLNRGIATIVIRLCLLHMESQKIRIT